MPVDFNPVLDKVYQIENYCVLFFSSGQGIFQVDFKNYIFDTKKAVFLSPGQYFKLLYGDLNISLHEFTVSQINLTENSRFLFRHLVGLGHIDIDETGQFYSDLLTFINRDNKEADVLKYAVNDWVKLNPFSATTEEVNLLFDFKEIIDEKFAERVDLNKVYEKLRQNGPAMSKLFREKLQFTANKLLVERVLLEAKRKVVFTDSPTKIIAYETGFSDPAYFNRFFKEKTNLTPTGFREKYHYEHQEPFVTDLFYLINEYHKTQHSIRFYAERLRMTERYLARKIQQSLNTSVKQLISDKLTTETKTLLLTGIKVNAIAFDLGFKEPNHLTTFFKKQTGLTPTEFLAKH